MIKLYFEDILAAVCVIIFTLVACTGMAVVSSYLSHRDVDVALNSER